MQKFTNEVMNDNFSLEKKAAAFDSIAELYYCHNFGTAAKSEIDLLMFKIYMEAAIENHLNPDNSIDYAACSDYKIGTVLGITPAKVRNLKLKKELVYPQENFDWKVSLKHILSVPENIKVEDDMLIMNIPDPNLFDAVQDSIEDMGGYVELVRNKKILRVQEKYLIDLIYMVAEGDSEKEAIKKGIDNILKQVGDAESSTDGSLRQKIKKVYSREQ